MLFCSCVFQSFCIAITSHGEERATLSAFRTFVRFAHIWFCRFPLSLGVWEGLRLVSVALPGLFSFFFVFLSSKRVITGLSTSSTIHDFLVLSNHIMQIFR